MPTTIEQQEIQSGGRSLWFGLLAGPIVYSVHFLVVYLLVEAACKADLLHFSVLSFNGIAVSVLVLTILAALINLVAGVLTYRTWQRRKDIEGGTQGSYAPFMALVGVWLNGLFAITILATGIPPLFLQPCGWA